MHHGGPATRCLFTLMAGLLLALSALPPVRTVTVLRWLGRLGLVGIAAAAIGVWILPAVPTLPQPDGRYAVATQVYRWTDAARDEPHTADPTDRRSVIAQAWYPTTRRSWFGVPRPSLYWSRPCSLDRF